MWGIAVYVLVAVCAVTLIWRSRYFKLSAIPIQWTLLAFGVKALAGVIFYWVYTHHYTQQTTLPDAFRYVNDARLIAATLFDHPDVFMSIMFGLPCDDPAYFQLTEQMIGWHSGYLYGLTNDCSTIIRLNVPIALFAQNSFMVHAILFSFLSFIGCVLLHKATSPYIDDTQKKWLFALLFFSPTQLFWTCSPTKEAALLPVFGLLFFLISLWHRQLLRPKHALWLLLVIPGLIFIKQYVLFALLPGLIYFLAQKALPSVKPLALFLGVLIFCGVIGHHAHYFFIGGDFLYVVGKKLTDFNNLAAIQNAGSFIEVPPSPSWLAFAQNYPGAFALSYLRPWLWESKSWIYWPFVAENAAILLLLVYSAFRFHKPPTQQLPWVFILLGTVIVMAAILGNTVPILGAVIRYRTPGLLVLYMLCVLIAKPIHPPFSLQKGRPSKALGK